MKVNILENLTRKQQNKQLRRGRIVKNKEKENKVTANAAKMKWQKLFNSIREIVAVIRMKRELYEVMN